MAVGALSRRVPVNHDFLASDRAGLDMALGAVNVGVATGQGEVSFSVVIKGGGHPAQRIVAISAVRPIVLGQELFVVRVGVTRFALRWRALKTRSRRGNGLVAVRARHRSMGPQQGIVGLRVIEATDLSPGLYVVASFAAQRASIRAPSCHLVAEFSLVRVRVAGGTAPILKVERQNLVRSPAQPNLVAIGAGNCRMRSLKREA